MIFIFYFRLGQGRMAGGAPVDRLFLAVKRAGGDELSQFPDLCRLVSVIDRAVGVLPVAQNSQSSKLLPLYRDIFLRILLAQPAHL